MFKQEALILGSHALLTLVMAELLLLGSTAGIDFGKPRPDDSSLVMADLLLLGSNQMP